MKIEKTKRRAMTETITIRLQKESWQTIKALSKEYEVSMMIIVDRIIEKSLKDKNFSIQL